MATEAELAVAFARAAPAIGEPSPERLARLVELVADARRARPGLELADEDLVAAIARSTGGDFELMERCQPADLALAICAGRGGASAIAELERAHGGTIAQVCRRFAGPGHSVDDLHQLLRERLFVSDAGDRPKLLEYDGQSSLASWLRITAVRLFIDVTRGRDRAREAAITDDRPEAWAPVDLGLDPIKPEYRAAVRAALTEAARQLASGDRHILRQHLVLGMSIDQLGAALGIHRTVAARRVAKARDELAAITRRLIGEQLSLGSHELGEVCEVVASRLDLSIRTLLATSRP